MHDHESSPPDLNGVEFLLQLLENFEKGGAALQIIVRSWVYEKYFVQHREYWERVLSVDGINRRLMITRSMTPRSGRTAGRISNGNTTKALTLRTSFASSGVSTEIGSWCGVKTAEKECAGWTASMEDKLSTEEVLRFISIMDAFPGVNTYIKLRDHTYRRLFGAHNATWQHRFLKNTNAENSTLHGWLKRPDLPVHRWQKNASDVRIYITNDAPNDAVVFCTWRDELQVCLRAGVHNHNLPGKCSCSLCKIDQIHTV